MSGLRDLMDGYLVTRRALGLKLTAPGKTLDAFVAWMEEAGEPTIRRDLATTWVSQFSRGTVLERLNYVRQFAEHVAWFDPETEVPVLDGRPYGSHRPRPLIFTGDQVDALLAAAGRLTPRIRAASWQTLLGMLTVTGMRISEARGLNDHDLTPDESGDGSGWAQVTDTKFGKSRLVPLHASAMVAIGKYQRLRDQTLPTPKTTAVFVARRGTRIARSTAGNTFREIREMAGLAGTSVEPAARLHDFRHSFATNTLIGHIRSGGDVDRACCTPGSTPRASRSGSGTRTSRQRRSTCTPTWNSNAGPSNAFPRSTSGHHPATRRQTLSSRASRTADARTVMLTGSTPGTGAARPLTEPVSITTRATYHRLCGLPHKRCSW